MTVWETVKQSLEEIACQLGFERETEGHPKTGAGKPSTMRVAWGKIKRYCEEIGRRRFGFAAAVYLGFVGVIAVRLPRDHAGAQYVAATDLPKNHRITAGDLRRPQQWPYSAGWYMPDRDALEGKYLKEDRKHCEPVTAEHDVAAAPDLTSAPDEVLVTVPFASGSQLTKILDPEATVEIRGSVPAGAPSGTTPAPAPAPMTKEAKVRAVLCDAAAEKAPPACYAVLAVKRDDEPSVSLAKDLRIVPKTIPSRETCK